MTRPPLDIWSEIRRTAVLVDGQTRASDLNESIGKQILGIEDSVSQEELIRRFTELQSDAGILCRLILNLDAALGFDTREELGAAGHLLDRGQRDQSDD